MNALVPALAALAALAVAPRPTLDAVQAALVRQRDALWAEANAHAAAGRDGQAHAAALRVLDLEKRVFGPRHPECDGTQYFLAGIDERAGRWDDAVARHREVVAGWAVLGLEGNGSLAEARVRLADAVARPGLSPAQRRDAAESERLSAEVKALRTGKEPAKAVPLARRGLELAERSLGPGHWATARARGQLALLLTMTGKYAEAQALFENAIAVLGEQLGDGHDETVNALNGLSSLYQLMGDGRKALPLTRRVLAGCRRILSPADPRIYDVAARLAVLLRDTGLLAEALPLFGRVLAYRREVFGPRSAGVGEALVDIAHVHFVAGRFARAEAVCREGLAVQRAALGPRHPLTATAMSNLAGTLLALGRHEEAMAVARQALKAHRDGEGVRTSHYAFALNTLGLIHKDTGAYDEAARLFRQALDAHKAARGEGHPESVVFLNNLGVALSEAAARDDTRRDDLLHEALALAGRVSRIIRASVGPEHHLYATSLNNLATQLNEMGDAHRADVLLGQAVRLTAAAFGERHPAYATYLKNAAAVRGDVGMARRALALHRDLLGERHPQYAAALHTLAAVLARRGDLVAAREAAGRALAATFTNLRDDAAVQSDRQLLAAAATRRHHLHLRLSLRDAGGYGDVVAWKGAALLGQQERRLFARLAADPAAKEAAARLGDATRRLAMLAASPSATRAALDALTLEQSEAQAELSRLSAGFRKERAEQLPTPEAVARALPDGAALVDYFAYTRFHARGEVRGEEHLAAFVSRKGRGVVRIDLGPSMPGRRAADAWREAITRGGGGEDEAARLHAIVWKPLLKHLEGVKSVLVCPDGALARVPFAALPGSKAGTYLLEEMPVSVVPSPRTLFRAAEAAPANASLLTVGGVEFGKGWAALPATASEARGVEGSFRAFFPRGSVTALTGRGAAREPAARAMEKHPYVHLATHGYFAEKEGRDPLLSGGIVLAGDAVLTALEVAELDLSRCRLAVLSACETGLGKDAAGEGLLGLQRAFQVAGAGSVVASLWKVPDGATAALMERFYANLWRRGMTRAEALREAQLFVLNHGRRHPEVVRGLTLPSGTTTMKPKDGRTPPFHWAAWALSGDWR